MARFALLLYLCCLLAAADPWPPPAPPPAKPAPGQCPPPSPSLPCLPLSSLLLLFFSPTPGQPRRIRPRRRMLPGVTQWMTIHEHARD